jgi:uncharacterized protein
LGVIEGVILDTGPLVAYLIEEDDHHQWAVETFRSLPPLFWTCEAVLTEAIYLLGGEPTALGMIRTWLDNRWIQLPFRFVEHHQRVLGLIAQYHSVPMDFADACVVRLSELLTGCPVLTVDSDFRVFRKNRRETIRTIMPPG